jgi:hypothetical protein
MMNRRWVSVACAFYWGLCGLLPPLAWAQSGTASRDLDVNPIGKVLAVTGTAHVEHSAAVIVQASLPNAGDVPAKVGDLVYRNDVVRTEPDGALNIVFADGTTFNISSNAKMQIDDFVYDPNGHSNSALMSLTTGTYTFIAGKIAHTGDMKVDTPVGTMGIRGTTPHIEISPDGTTKFSTLVEQK